MKIHVPGKIFISGEYAALKGMPALTVAVKPCFEFDSTPTIPVTDSLFHSESPAGKLATYYKSQVEGDFYDPYKGIGGLGRSTAEFLAVAQKTIGLADEWHVWSQYRHLQQEVQNPPSGVDLLTQLKGGYCITETSKLKLDQTNWPFHQYDWVALVTGNKVKTHDHLASTLELDWSYVERLSRQVVDSFQQKNAEKFLIDLRSWRHFLLDRKLEVSATTELVDFFMDIPGVAAVKGCGALGSDVVLIIFEKGHSELLDRSLLYWKPEHVIRSNQVCMDGLKVTNDREVFSSL